MTTAPVSVRIRTYTRQDNGKLEPPYEEPIVVPHADEHPLIDTGGAQFREGLASSSRRSADHAAAADHRSHALR